MNGFRLTLAPRIHWTDLTRDLIASGSARSGLSVDRFADLLVLAEQVASDLLAGDESVVVSLKAAHETVDVTFQASTSGPGTVSKMAIESLADRHWDEEVPEGRLTGFSFVA